MENQNESKPEIKEYVLVVDDSFPNRNILAHMLKKLAFNVKDVANGEEAWKTLEESRAEGQVATIVFSDIMMPKVNGISLLRKIRETEEYKGVKVVLITAILDRQYIADAKNLNVDGYILKPVSFDKIRKKLIEFFPDREFPNFTETK